MAEIVCHRFVERSDCRLTRTVPARQLPARGHREISSFTSMSRSRSSNSLDSSSHSPRRRAGGRPPMVVERDPEGTAQSSAPPALQTARRSGGPGRCGCLSGIDSQAAASARALTRKIRQRATCVVRQVTVADGRDGLGEHGPWLPVALESGPPKRLLRGRSRYIVYESALRDREKTPGIVLLENRAQQCSDIGRSMFTAASKVSKSTE